MFAPAIGITEDPVTGNANGPLGGYLVAHNLVNHNGEHFEFTGCQGEAINRYGEVYVSVKIVNNNPGTIKIKGNARVVFGTELSV